MYYSDTQNPSVEWLKVQEESKGVWVATIFLGQKIVSENTFKSFSRAFSWGEAVLETLKDERGSN